MSEAADTSAVLSLRKQERISADARREDDRRKRILSAECRGGHRNIEQAGSDTGLTLSAMKEKCQDFDIYASVYKYVPTCSLTKCPQPTCLELSIAFQFYNYIIC